MHAAGQILKWWQCFIFIYIIIVVQHRPANLHLLRAFGSLLQAEFTESRLKRIKSEAGEFVSGSEDEHIHQQHIHMRGDWTEEKHPIEEEDMTCTCCSSFHLRSPTLPLKCSPKCALVLTRIMHCIIVHIINLVESVFVFLHAGSSRSSRCYLMRAVRLQPEERYCSDRATLMLRLGAELQTKHVHLDQIQPCRGMFTWGGSRSWGETDTRAKLNC